MCYPIKLERKLFNTHFAHTLKLRVAILSLESEKKTAVHFELALMKHQKTSGNRNFF